ncbi:outer membrane protein assembly factor BamB family protein [Candidatus Pyrohabitans sp.]
MFRKVALLVLLAFVLPQVYATCPRDVYYAAPGKNLEVMTLSSLDLDPGTKGVQSSIRVAPLQRIRGTLTWKFGSHASGEARVNLFGNWSRGEIARLYSGTAIPNQSTSVEFSFFAPPEPGDYTLTAVFAFDGSFASDIRASNLCSPCPSQGRCAVAFAFADIEVLNTTPALYAEITSPEAGKVFSVGEGITINARTMPENATVVVRINATPVAESLPYVWDTSGISQGEYPIEVVVSFANRSFATAVNVRLVNNSLTRPEFYEIVPPRQPEEVDATLQSLVVAAGKKVYILSLSGDMLGTVSTGKKPLISASDEQLLLAEGNLLSAYHGAKRVWNASIDTNVELIAASSRGVSVVAGGKLYLFNTAGALLWTKQLGFKAAVLEMSSYSIGLAEDGRVHVLSYDGAPVWNISFGRPVVALAMEGETLFTLTGAGIHAYAGGRPLWNITPAQNMSLLSAAGGHLLAASRDSVELYDAQKGRLIWRYYPRKGVDYATISPNASRIFIISGERILAIPLAGERLAGLSGRKAGVIALFVFAAAVLFFLLRKGKSPRPMAEEQVHEEVLPTLHVRVKSSKGGAPVSGASVELEKHRETTDDRGIATFRVKPGRVSISVEKEGFKPVASEFTLRGVSSEVDVELEPVHHLGREEEERLEELRSAIDEAYERVAGHDPCLPAYFRSIGYVIIEGIGALVITPEFRKSPAHVSALLTAAEETVPLICEAMQDWKNIALYRSSGKPGPANCRAPEFSLEEALSMLLEGLPEEGIEEEIFQTDRRITSMIREVSTYPPASLWQISKKLFERGKRSPSPEAQAFFLLSRYLLTCVEDMLSNEEVLSRLRGSIV